MEKIASPITGALGRRSFLQGAACASLTAAIAPGLTLPALAAK